MFKCVMISSIKNHSRSTRFIVPIVMLIVSQLATTDLYAGNWICPEADALKVEHDTAYNSWFSGGTSSEEVSRLQNLWFASKDKCDSDHRAELKEDRDGEKSEREKIIEKLLTTSSPVEALRLIRNSANSNQAEREQMRKRIGDQNMADLDSRRLEGAHNNLSADLTEGAINLIYSVTNNNLDKLHNSMMSFDSGLRQSPIYLNQYITASQNTPSANASAKEKWEERRQASWEQRKKDHLAAKERERQELLLQAQARERAELYEQAQVNQADTNPIESSAFSDVMSILNTAIEIKSAIDGSAARQSNSSNCIPMGDLRDTVICR